MLFWFFDFIINYCIPDAQPKPMDIDHVSCCKQCEKKNDFKTCGMKECCETEKQPCPSCK